MKNENTVFFIKFILFYNIYANLMILGDIIIGFIVYSLFGLNLKPGLFFPLTILLLIVAVFLLVEAILITSGYQRKFKFYRVTTKRIEKHGYKDIYFEQSMYEPCMRIISKDILRKFGVEHQYKILFEKYGHEDMNLKKQKDDLIAKLNKLDANSIEFK